MIDYLYVFGRKVILDGAVKYFADVWSGQILRFGFVPNLEHRHFYPKDKDMYGNDIE